MQIRSIKNGALGWPGLTITGRMNMTYPPDRGAIEANRNLRHEELSDEIYRDALGISSKVFEELMPPKLKFAFEQKNDAGTGDKTGKTESTEKPEKNEKSAKNEKSEKANKDLWGQFAGKESKSAICPDACIQPTGLGNCYFVAAMAAVAKTDPERLQNMIKVEEDGTYTVKFPGLEKSYNVKAPTADEIGTIDGGIEKYGSWPLILMKAFGQHYGGGKDGRSEIYGADHGSVRSAGMNALYKEGVKNGGIGASPLFMSENDIHTRLMDKINPKNPKDAIPVTASSLLSDKGISGRHVYTVMKYEADPAKVGDGKITLRNPWGGPDATKVLSISEFKKIFSQISYPEISRNK